MGQASKPKLIKKGAEASIYVATWHGRQVIMKKRLRKSYRVPLLDNKIRIRRTVYESQLLHEAKTVGVPTPFVLFVDKPNSTIVMEYVKGNQVKMLLNQTSYLNKLRLCLDIGCSAGRLHLHGIIHGDLTTSNLILTKRGDIVFVDFGLGEKSMELEAYAVDLHLMKRALQSTHFDSADECFRTVMKGYSRIVGTERAKDVLVKISEIERRGRYVSDRKA